MSHEIRTPLNGVIGMADLLRDTPLNGEQYYLVDIICSSGKLLLKLVNDILDFAKIEAGRLELHSTDFDLDELLTDLTGSLGFAAQRKDVELILAVAPDVPSRLCGEFCFTSEPGVGSEFSFILPFARSASEEAPVCLGTEWRDARILVVDDNATSRQALRQMLTAYSQHTVETADGMAALELLRQGQAENPQGGSAASGNPPSKKTGLKDRPPITFDSFSTVRFRPEKRRRQKRLRYLPDLGTGSGLKSAGATQPELQTYVSDGCACPEMAGSGKAG